MNSDDRVLAAVAARNPVPDPEALSSEERATADAVRIAVLAAPLAPAGRRAGRAGQAGRDDRAGRAGRAGRDDRAGRAAAFGIGEPRRGLRHALVIAAAVTPVAVVLVLALGTRGAKHPLVPGAQPSGPPQTLLIIGSDHRAGEPYVDSNTDTMLLVRIAPGAPAVNILSIPRNLRVQTRLDGHLATVKLNAVYNLGGPRRLLRVLRTQVFHGLRVTHILDVNFAGFSDAIDTLGCVYADVDHRYFNDAVYYSSIDIEPGYQKLCGDNQSVTGALAFVRYRHAESDRVHQARLLDFLHWLSGDLAATPDAVDIGRLLAVLAEHAQTDGTLHSAGALRSEVELMLDSLHDQLVPIPYPATSLACTPRTPCYVTSTKRAQALAYARFLSLSPTTYVPPRTIGSEPVRLASGVTAGRAQAAALLHAGLPLYYPAQIAPGSTFCSSRSGNCDTPHEPGAAELANQFAGAYPRAYDIGANGHSYPSYRMTLQLNPALVGDGQYYGIQGTTWRNPPILRVPTRTERIDGRTLLEYYDLSGLSLVAWRTPIAVYWISNTLTDLLPPREMIAIAASLRLGG